MRYQDSGGINTKKLRKLDMRYKKKKKIEHGEQWHLNDLLVIKLEELGQNNGFGKTQSSGLSLSLRGLSIMWMLGITEC